MVGAPLAAPTSEVIHSEKTFENYYNYVSSSQVPGTETFVDFPRQCDPKKPFLHRYPRETGCNGVLSGEEKNLRIV